MRRILTLCAAIALHPALIPPCHADDKQDRERRVRVALALAAADTPAVAAADCGKCREDLPESRADGVREGKPVVLFVGGCPGGKWSDAVTAAGAIPVKAPQYDGDGRPKAEKRIVVLEPKADRSGMWIAATLPAASDPQAVSEAVKRATPKAEAKPPAPVAPAPLNWQF